MRDSSRSTTTSSATCPVCCPRQRVARYGFATFSSTAWGSPIRPRSGGCGRRAPPHRIRQQFLRQRFSHVRKLRFAPGSRAAYTNLGYLLLGSVIAAAAGQPFTEFVQDEVLLPLGMRTTGFTFPDDTASVVVTGHQRLVVAGGPLLGLHCRTGSSVDARGGG